MMERGKISEILDTTLITSIPDDGERKNPEILDTTLITSIAYDGETENLRNFRHNTHHINP
jgi:hypothetical protein